MLDLGTGSGAIVLALLSHYREAIGGNRPQRAGTEPGAGKRCALGLAGADFHCGEWFTPLAAGDCFDLIVSNPPYLTEQEMTTAAPEVVAHEPERALVAGVDGLDDLRVIVAEAPRFLRPGGLLALETGIAQHEQLREWAAVAGFSDFSSLEDLSGRPRFVVLRR